MSFMSYLWRHMKKTLTIEYEGVTHTVRTLAARLDISVTAARNYILAGSVPSQIRWVEPRGERYPYGTEGELLTAREIAERDGVCHQAVYKRYKAERFLRNGVAHSGFNAGHCIAEKKTIDGVVYTARSMAEAFGVSMAAARKAFNASITPRRRTDRSVHLAVATEAAACFTST